MFPAKKKKKFTTNISNTQADKVSESVYTGWCVNEFDTDL